MTNSLDPDRCCILHCLLECLCLNIWDEYGVAIYVNLCVNQKQTIYHEFMKTTLRKHAYSNIKKISPPKMENFQVKNSDIFHISAQNIDCGYSLEPPRQGSSNKYPQSMF